MILARCAILGPATAVFRFNASYLPDFLTVSVIALLNGLFSRFLFLVLTINNKSLINYKLQRYLQSSNNLSSHGHRSIFAVELWSMIHRLCKPLLSNSFFLFGARGTGKTRLIRSLFDGRDVKSYDLLEDSLAMSLNQRPELLRSGFLVEPPSSLWIVLDEVQRCPGLLNIAHKMIEQDGVHFALTGSSARKLKRGGANLLAGRAFVYQLFPFTSFELRDRFILSDALTFGTLPKLLSLSTDAEKKKYLESYAMMYIKEEIVAEQIVRKLTPFRRFLQVSAQMSGKCINYSALGRDVGADTKTVISYFDILEETHMGFRLEPFHTSVRKAQKMAPKFYWFDSGVRRALESTLDFAPAPGTSYYGELFEEFVVNEINRLNSYCETGYRMSYLSTHNSGAEIDVILSKGGGRKIIAIEIKSSSSAPEQKEVYRLKNSAGDCGATQIFYISLHPDPHLIAGVRCLFWQDALREIFLSNQQHFRLSPEIP